MLQRTRWQAETPDVPGPWLFPLPPSHGRSNHLANIISDGLVAAMIVKLLASLRCGIGLSFAIGFADGWTVPAAFAAENKPVDFARQIQPLLIKRCSECHGPDKPKNNLRLDRRADALKGGKSGLPAFVPGKSGESELIKRITTSNAEDIMPPKGEPLTAEQIALLRKWIDQGAE